MSQVLKRLRIALAVALAGLTGAASAAPATVAKDYMLLVFADAFGGREAAFNRWYDSDHLPDVVALPGFVDGRRYAIADKQIRPGGKEIPSFGRYLAIYHIRTNNLAAVFKEMNRRVEAQETKIDETLDPATLHGFTYEAFRKPYDKAGTTAANPNYVHLVFTEAKEGQDDEYNRWYDASHVPDIVAVPGFVRGQRYVQSPVQMSAAGPTRYLVRFDVATDDWSKTLDGFYAAAPAMKMSPAFNGSKTTGFTYKAIGPVMTHAEATARRR